jgi:hypothetical protein
MDTNTSLAAGSSADRWHNRLATLVGTTFIIWFFSEMFFLNEGELFYAWSKKQSVLQLLLDVPLVLGELVLYYGFFVLWFLTAIAFFRVRSLWALVFAAAICGWAIEGSVIPIMYFEMPGALLWPAASWHVLINVFLGWWLLRKVIETQPLIVVAVVFAVLGAWWSIWATWFWPVVGTGSMEDFSLPMSPGEFTFVAFVSGLVLTIGYFLIDRFGRASYNPGPKAMMGFVVIGSLLTLLGSQGYAAIFFALVGMACIFLIRNRKDEAEANILSTFKGNTPLRNIAAVMTMPGVAVVIYPLWYHNGISINHYVGLVVGLINLVSLALFVYGGYMIFSRRTVE